MRLPLVRARRWDAGFTLLEALIAIALMGLILGALASVTAQWLPTWNRGLVQTQRNEQVAVALDRLAADLSAAQFVTANRENAALFQGDDAAVVFVRPVLGPNNGAGLEFVRIAEMTDSRGRALVRTRAPFVPLPSGDPSRDPIPFADPVVLLRAPYRVTFAYAGPRGEWLGSWPQWAGLPSAVRFDVQDAERRVVLSTATGIRAEMAAPQPAQVADAPAEAHQNNAREAR